MRNPPTVSTEEDDGFGASLTPPMDTNSPTACFAATSMRPVTASNWSVTFTERWTFALSSDEQNPWQITATDAPALTR